MKTAQLQYGSGKWIVGDLPEDFPAEKAQLVLVLVLVN